MLRKLSPIICLVLLSSPAWAEEGDVDCTQRMDNNMIGNCCRRPRLNFDAFQQSCGRFMQDGTPRMSPCLYDCIFNSSNVLNGLQLNVENARSMLEKMLGNNKEYVDLHVRSLQNCTENASIMLRSVRRRSFGAQACSQLPLFLSLCTVENMFVHCPATSWTRSPMCEKARDFMLRCNCDPNGKVCMQLMRYSRK